MVRTLMMLVALAMVGCGGFQTDTCQERTDRICVFHSEGLTTAGALDPARVDRVVDAAARYWGAEDGRVLDGWVLDLWDHSIDTFSVGRTHLDAHYIEVDATVAPCLEATALVHEVGHAIIGDPNHADPRWSHDRMRPLADELEAWIPRGEPSCPCDMAYW